VLQFHFRPALLDLRTFFLHNTRSIDHHISVAAVLKCDFTMDISKNAVDTRENEEENDDEDDEDDQDYVPEKDVDEEDDGEYN